MESKRKKKIPIPEDMKRLIIGRHRSGLEHISKDTNANLFLKSNEIYVEGTDEQIGLAEKLIHERLVGFLKAFVLIIYFHFTAE